MAEITENTVKHIARLARISLGNEEVNQYTHDLDSILRYVDQLNEVSTDDVRPLKQVSGLRNVFREDVVTNQSMRNELLANTPLSDKGYIKVKTVK